MFIAHVTLRSMKLQVGVKALIQNENKQFLFMRRAVTFGEEKEPHWDIPGGRIDVEEPLLEALRREIMEETGLRFDNEPVLLAAQDIFATHADLHVVRLTYRLEGTGKPNLSDEHQEVKWMTQEEALQSTLDPYTTEVLKKQKSA
jgi:8-oxo-dGTP diphosphatase